jgi:hypothetical protein
MPTLEFGNHSRLSPLPGTEDGPAVTTVHIPTGDGGLTLEPGLDVEEFRRHLADAQSHQRPTECPNHEAALIVPNMWRAHASELPKWVASDGSPDGDELARISSEYFQIPMGRPGLFDDLYYRRVGQRTLIPGVPSGVGDPQAIFTNVGREIWANNFGGGQVGTSGTATATTATSLTAGAITSVTTNQYAANRLIAGTVWGNIVTNTSGTTPVFTVDRWYNPASPGGAAGTTPSGTTTFLIEDGGGSSAWFVGITNTNISPAATDTALSGEQTTQGMGRKIAPFAITSAVAPASFTLTPSWTYTGSTSITFYAIACFVSMLIADTTNTMIFETLLSTSATVTTNGQQVTVTETVVGS